MWNIMLDTRSMFNITLIVVLCSNASAASSFHTASLSSFVRRRLLLVIVDFDFFISFFFIIVLLINCGFWFRIVQLIIILSFFFFILVIFFDHLYNSLDSSLFVVWVFAKRKYMRKNCWIWPVTARHLSGIVVTWYLICHFNGSDLLLLDGKAVDAEEGSDLVDSVNGELHKQEESHAEYDSSHPALWKNVILGSSFNLKSFQSG